MAVVWDFLCKIFYCVVGIPVLLFTWGALYIGQLLGIASCAGAGLPTAKWVEDSFSLQLDGAILEEAWDNHGGFHGDGNTYIVLTLPTSIEEQITAINEEYIDETKAGGPWYSISEYSLAYASMAEEVKDYRGDTVEYPKLLPEITNGYFCVIDNFDNKDEYVFISEDANLGSFWNWEMAIYDMDTMKLYYYESDM